MTELPELPAFHMNTCYIWFPIENSLEQGNRGSSVLWLMSTPEFLGDSEGGGINPVQSSYKASLKKCTLTFCDVFNAVSFVFRPVPLGT